MIENQKIHSIFIHQTHPKHFATATVCRRCTDSEFKDRIFTSKHRSYRKDGGRPAEASDQEPVNLTQFMFSIKTE